MTAQEAVNKLADHLLGKDWYIVDPVCNEQANDIIVEEICSKYKAIDESPVDRYRRRSRKCKWCRHCSDSGVRCNAKDETIIWDGPRIFCSCFELKRAGKYN